MGRTRIEIPASVSAAALDEERVELRIRLAVLRDKLGDPNDIALLAFRVEQIGKQINRLRQTARRKVG